MANWEIDYQQKKQEKAQRAEAERRRADPILNLTDVIQGEFKDDATASQKYTKALELIDKRRDTVSPEDLTGAYEAVREGLIRDLRGQLEAGTITEARRRALRKVESIKFTGRTPEEEAAFQKAKGRGQLAKKDVEALQEAGPGFEKAVRAIPLVGEALVTPGLKEKAKAVGRQLSESLPEKVERVKRGFSGAKDLLDKDFIDASAQMTYSGMARKMSGPASEALPYEELEATQGDLMVRRMQLDAARKKFVEDVAKAEEAGTITPEKRKEILAAAQYIADQNKSLQLEEGIFQDTVSGLTTTQEMAGELPLGVAEGVATGPMITAKVGKYATKGGRFLAGAAMEGAVGAGVAGALEAHRQQTLKQFDPERDFDYKRWLAEVGFSGVVSALGGGAGAMSAKFTGGVDPRSVDIRTKLNAPEFDPKVQEAAPRLVEASKNAVKAANERIGELDVPIRPAELTPVESRNLIDATKTVEERVLEIRNDPSLTSKKQRLIDEAAAGTNHPLLWREAVNFLEQMKTGGRGVLEEVDADRGLYRVVYETLKGKVLYRSKPLEADTAYRAVMQDPRKMARVPDWVLENDALRHVVSETNSKMSSLHAEVAEHRAHLRQLEEARLADVFPERPGKAPTAEELLDEIDPEFRKRTDKRLARQEKRARQSERKAKKRAAKQEFEKNLAETRERQRAQQAARKLLAPMSPEEVKAYNKAKKAAQLEDKQRIKRLNEERKKLAKRQAKDLKDLIEAKEEVVFGPELADYLKSRRTKAAAHIQYLQEEIARLDVAKTVASDRKKKSLSKKLSRAKEQLAKAHKFSADVKVREEALARVEARKKRGVGLSELSDEYAADLELLMADKLSKMNLVEATSRQGSDSLLASVKHVLKSLALADYVRNGFGRSGEMFGAMTDTFSSLFQRSLGMDVARWNPVAKRLSRSERTLLNEALGETLKTGKSVANEKLLAFSPKMRDTYRVMLEILADINDTAKAAGLRVRNLAGETVLFRGNETVPPAIKESVMRNLHKDADLRTKFFKELIELNTDQFDEAAMKEFLVGQNEEMLFNKLSTLSIDWTGVKLPQWAVEEDVIKNFTNYIIGARRKLAHTRVFGADEVKLKELRSLARKELGTVDADRFDELMDLHLGRRIAKDPGRLASSITAYNTVTKLTYGWIPNLSEAVQKVGFMTDNYEAAKVVFDMLANMATLGRKGVNQVEAQRAYLSGVDDRLLDLAKETGDQEYVRRWLKLTGFEKSEVFARRKIVHHGINHTNRKLKGMQKRFKKTGTIGIDELTHYKRLESMFGKARASEILERGTPLTQTEEALVGNWFLKETFPIGMLDRPAYWNTPTGRIVFQFKTWPHKHTRTLKKHVYDELTKNKNPAPFIRWVLGGFILGEMTNDMKHTLTTGNINYLDPRERPQDLRRFTNNMLAQGGIGIINDFDRYVRDGVMGGQLEVLAGPAVSDFSALGKALGTAAEGDLVEAAGQASRVLGGVGKTGRAIGAGFGVDVRTQRERQGTTEKPRSR